MELHKMHPDYDSSQVQLEQPLRHRRRASSPVADTPRCNPAYRWRRVRSRLHRCTLKGKPFVRFISPQYWGDLANDSFAHMKLREGARRRSAELSAVSAEPRSYPKNIPGYLESKLQFILDNYYKK